MMKHQDWVSNRGYVQHLNVLTKIYARRTARTPRNCTTARNHQSQQRGESPPQQEVMMACKSKDNLTMREQQILWDNYHLGKRIIETSPVISKKKFDDEYRKHKKLVRGLTASSNNKSMPTEFRVKKLQEYKENFEQMGQDRAIQTATHKHYLKLSIVSLIFYRQKPALDEIIIILTHYTKEGKPKRQKLPNFPSEQLLQRKLYFHVPKRVIQSQDPLVVQMQQFRGLDQQSIGYFSFPVSEDQPIKAKVFHCGKPIGQVYLECSVGRKPPAQKFSS